MPASPWTTFREVKADQVYLVQLTYLPLKRYRMLFRFLRYSSVVQKQLASAEGAVGFSLRAKPLRREFWTMSVWTNREALMDFTRSAPHYEIMRALDRHMRKTVFIDWQCKGSELPPAWKSALKRFEAGRAA